MNIGENSTQPAWNYTGSIQNNVHPLSFNFFSFRIEDLLRKKTYICVKLPNKAREIIVLEVSGQKTHGKGLWIPNNEAIVATTPRNYMVCGSVLHDVVGFCEKRGRTSVMKSLHWLRNSCRCHAWVRWTSSRILFLHLAQIMIHDWELKKRAKIQCGLDVFFLNEHKDNCSLGEVRNNRWIGNWLWNYLESKGE